MAELARRVFTRQSKSKVTVQSDTEHVTMETTAEDSLPRVTTELGPDTIQNNTTSTAEIRSPSTTQSQFPSTKPTKHTDVRIENGRKAAAEGKYKEAIASFNKVLPATVDSIYYRGCARLQSGKQIEIETAIEDFNQALNLTQAQTNTNIYYKRAFACQSIGRYSEAIIDYSMFIKYTSDDMQHIGYLNRGLVYGELGKHDEALKDISHANEKCPTPSNYYIYCLARAEAAAEHSNEAKEIFQQLAKRCDDESQTSRKPYDSLFYHGVALYELNDYRNALEKLNEAFKHSGNNRDRAETKFYIGLCHFACDEIKSAKEELEQVLRYDETHPRALFRLGLLESQNNNSPTEGLTHLTNAHKSARHRSDILYERGDLHHKMGHLDACIHDKRLALQLQRGDADLSAMKHCYELLIQQLPSVIKQFGPNVPSDLYLALALSHEKRHTLSIDGDRSSISNPEYRRMISWCEQAMGPDVENVKSPLPFALLYSFHAHKKHVAAAMTRLDQLNDALDENSKLEEMFEKILKQIEKAKEKPQTNIHQHILNLTNVQNIQQTTNKEEISDMLALILADKYPELLMLAKERAKQKADEEYFDKDYNKNRKIFYQNMQSTFSHKFIAMAATSGDSDDEPIVKHDREETQTMIANGLCVIGHLIGAAMPAGGGAVSGISCILSCLLKQNEYNRFQDRMSLITENRDILELTDLGRQIARQLADRYKDQLLQLNPNVPEVPSTCCSCCKPILCCKKEKTTSAKSIRARGEKSPAVKVAKFGVIYAIGSIINEDSDYIKIYSDMKTADLAKSLVELICCAEPSIKPKALRTMNLDKDLLLPYEPPGGRKQDETPTVWHLYDFYSKPGIRIHIDEKTVEEKSLSWMKPNLHGYRLGTMDEWNYLDKRDKKAKEKSCCGC